MKVEGLEEKIRAVAGPLLADLGFELVDVVYATEHGRKVLRFFIDKPGGVTIDDCGDVSRELSTLLDVEDPIPQKYTLEVSSPGLDRPLVKEKDFVRFTGKKVKIKTKEPLEGRKNFKATIDSVEDGRVAVTDFDGKKFVIDLANIDRARLEIEI
ncbi:MAG: ribosome maturation factor RimP [Deltaproteobacteria bacterium]|nr:ribosome maturation factor RimP [Deltaproteobacteria bacterium]